jgi:hypothetical protein
MSSNEINQIEFSYSEENWLDIDNYYLQTTEIYSPTNHTNKTANQIHSPDSPLVRRDLLNIDRTFHQLDSSLHEFCQTQTSPINNTLFRYDYPSENYASSFHDSNFLFSSDLSSVETDYSINFSSEELQVCENVRNKEPQLTILSDFSENETKPLTIDSSSEATQVKKIYCTNVKNIVTKFKNKILKTTKPVLKQEPTNQKSKIQLKNANLNDQYRRMNQFHTQPFLSQNIRFMKTRNIENFIPDYDNSNFYNNDRFKPLGDFVTYYV